MLVIANHPDSIKTVCNCSRYTGPISITKLVSAGVQSGTTYLQCYDDHKGNSCCEHRRMLQDIQHLTTPLDVTTVDGVVD